MTIPTISSYQIKLSRTNHKIPIVNGVHLHSVYNPINEAKVFTDRNEKVFKNKNKTLILGLGLGYHIEKIILKMTEYHADDFQIVIIEPIKKLIDDCYNLGIIDFAKIKIFGGFSIDNLYQDIDFVNFLLQRPSIIAHPASFNLNNDYFKKLLSFVAPNQINEISKTIKNQKLVNYLSLLPQEMDIDSCIDNVIKNKNCLENDLDYLLLAFSKMINQENISAQNQSMEM